MENLLLIDGSAFAFIHANKENYQESLDEHLRRLCEIFYTDKYIFFLEKSKTNFRNLIGRTHIYKGHREANREKINDYLPYLSDCFEYCNKNFNPVIYYGIENDDALSITSRNVDSTKYRPIICGDDSDLMCIPGFHWKLKKNIEIEVTEPGTIELNAKGDLVTTGLYSTYSKILKGAQKENYKGLKGYGSKKVYSLLKEVTTEPDMRKLCFDLFTRELGYSEGVKKFEEGFRLCFLLRENKYFKMPEVQTLVINNNKKRKIWS